MVLGFETWYKAIEIRRSRRTFVSKQIEVEIKQRLLKVIDELNQLYEGVRILYVEKSPDPIFVGAIGPYGKITGAQAYFALVQEYAAKFNNEKVGFIGQAMVLEATRNGLSTCWAGGNFNIERAHTEVGISENEKVVAIIPVGYARKNLSLTEKMMYKNDEYHKRKSVNESIEGLPREQWPNWVEQVIRAASLSPSAYNRQAISYDVSEQGNSISLKIKNPLEETNIPKGIDRGIAMLHIEVAAKHFGINGEWLWDESSNKVIFQIKG